MHKLYLKHLQVVMEKTVHTNLKYLSQTDNKEIYLSTMQLNAAISYKQKLKTVAVGCYR